MITAYDDSVAAGWAGAAGVVYDPLAAALMVSCPIELRNARVLDAGSGTGAVASIAAAAGAQVVAADLSPAMMATAIGRPWPGVVADALALPFGPCVFDVAVAAFLINHLEPGVALRELARVLRPGGSVVASTWAVGADAVKSAIDSVLSAWGWHPPAWYREMKAVLDPVSGDPARLAAAAQQGGFGDVTAWVHAIDLGVRDPFAAVGYRLATPQVASWAATFDHVARQRLVEDAADAVAPLLADWRPAAVFLHGRACGQPSPRRSAARARASR